MRASACLSHRPHTPHQDSTTQQANQRATTCSHLRTLAHAHPASPAPQAVASRAPAVSSKAGWRRRGRCSSHPAAASQQAALSIKPSNKLKSVQLPSGLTISHCSTPAEVQFLYQEHYQDQVYLQHGIQLQPGDTVLDVGGNIGLFAMWCAEVVGPTGSILSCEPAPAAYQAACANLQLHSAAAAAKVAPVEVLPVALGAAPGEAEMVVYEQAAGWSTLYPDPQEVLLNMEAYLTTLLQQPHTGLNLGPLQTALVAGARVLSRLPPLHPLLTWLQRTYVQQAMLRDVTWVNVPVTTVDQLLAERPHIREVSLLKVDVERGELAVLRGVGHHTWPRIQQVVAEVHDSDGRLEAVRQLLMDAGLTQQCISQDTYLTGTNLVLLAAWRPSAA